LAEDTWIRFALASLATWRVTHLLAYEDGPADLIARLRIRVGHGFVGNLLDCFKCLSLWVAAPLALFVAWQPVAFVVAWLALSGGAILLQRLGREPVFIRETASSADGESDDVLLRPETSGGSEPVASGSGDSQDGDPRRNREHITVVR